MTYKRLLLASAFLVGFGALWRWPKSRQTKPLGLEKM